MIRKILFFVIAIVCFSEMHAQHYKINFRENETLQNILQEAKKENKLVFVDCCTTWCIPCRGMERNVFTIDSVADFFNAKFINLKMNMDQPNTKIYAKKYQIECYPSYLILYPTGNVMYKFIGGMSADKFMDNIRKGLNPSNEIAEMNRIYQSGSYSDDFIRKYIWKKLTLNEHHEAMAIAKKYFDKLTPEQRVLPENWMLFGHNKYELYLCGVNSSNFYYLLDHWYDFSAKNGNDTVFAQISNICRLTTSWTLRGWYFNDFKRNDSDFIKIKNKIASIPLPNKEQYMVMMDISKAVCDKDTSKVGRLLVGNIGYFTADNQQIMFDYMTMMRNKKFSIQDQIAYKVIDADKPSNLLNYLKTLYPSYLKKKLK